jgi:two-component system NtrC family sensor kinase
MLEQPSNDGTGPGRIVPPRAVCRLRFALPLEVLGSSKRTVGALRILLGASVLVPALLAGAAAWQSRRVLIDEAEQRTVKTATILENHVASTFEIYDLVFLRIEDFLRSRHGRPEPTELHEFLARLAKDVGRINGVFVVDANGVVLGRSREAVSRFPDVNVNDRDYFRALKDGAERRFVGAPAIGRASGQRRINVAHRLVSETGTFAGVAVVSIAEAYLTALYSALREQPGDVINIVRDDGVLLVRSPPAPNGDARYQPGEFRPLASPDAQGLYHKLSSLDGTERIYAFRRIAGLPLIVAFGLELDSVMAEWRTQVLIYAGIALPAALLLLVATWIALQRARREADAYAELRHETAQREAAEAALRQAQKMEALGQLTGGIAHDFNNLLTVIAGNIDLALRKLTDATVTRHLTASHNATERGRKLTQQLLAFARRRPLRAVVVSLPERLAETTAFVGQTMGSQIAIRVDVPADLWPVEVDDEQLQVALLNLIVNARDALPDGGEIRLAARNLRLPGAAREPVALVGDFVALSVSDSGKGIAPDVLPRVFEPFFTTKSVGHGSGLGLAQVYGFATQSNGLATIDSTPGRGTTVTLYLPRGVGAVVPRESAGAPAHELAGAGRRVLVVEDDPAVAEVAEGYLEAFGFHSVAVDRAAKALALLAEDSAFDLVLSDVIMPDGMSGIELAKQLARLYPSLPVLLTTGYAGTPSDVGELAIEVLRKPYNARALHDAIERALGGLHAAAPA